MKEKGMKYQIAMQLLCAAMCVNGVARADVMSRETYDAHLREKNNPALYDKVDQYCAKLGVNAACSIPGSPFEGGGAGTCVRYLAPRGTEIELSCVVSNPVEIARKVPAGPYQRDPGACPKETHAPAVPDPSGDPNACVAPPPVADQFCAGHEVDDACTAAFTAGGKAQSEAGRCSMTTEKYGYYRHGHQVATRRVILCLPKNPVNKELNKALKPVSIWSKLKMW